MKFYQIKSIEKDAKPPRWYRLLVPSGITFSQLYVLLGYVHKEQEALSAFFYFESAKRNLQIEEFVNGKPEFTDDFYDVYDAKGTYIDTFFKQGFKISQYTGRKSDLTIEVEKDAEEYDGLTYPVLLKFSNAIAHEEGGQPENGGHPLDMFKVTPDEARHFRSADELMADFGSGNLLHVSMDPVTPEKSICKGRLSRSMESLDEAMQPLREDKVLSGLIDQMEAGLNDPTKADPRILAKIDNRMLRLFGMPFSEYTFIATMRGIALDDIELPGTANKPNRLSVTTESFINRYTKEDLQLIAEDYDVILPAKKTKKSMAKAILQQLFTPDSIRQRLIQLDDGEMELFRLTAECEYGRFPETDEEALQAEDLIENLLAVPLRDDRLYVTDVLRNVYEESDKEALETERQKTVWMYKCLTIAEAFYGVMSWDVLGQLYARKIKGISREELMRIYRRTPDYYNDFEECDGRLVLYYFIDDDYYKYLENSVQQDKPFYIPSRREIEEFYEKGCLLSSASHQAMYRFLKNNLGYSKHEAEAEVAQIYISINNNERMQTVVDSVTDMLGEDGAFASQKDVEKFAHLYMDMCNHSHIMANRGYSPNDLFYAMGGARSLPKDFMITPRGPEAARLLDEARDELAKNGIRLDEEGIKSMLEDEKRRKIGRNEPCPCGSGKKYKNCCGK